MLLKRLLGGGGRMPHELLRMRCLTRVCGLKIAGGSPENPSLTLVQETSMHASMHAMQVKSHTHVRTSRPTHLSYACICLY